MILLLRDILQRSDFVTLRETVYSKLHPILEDLVDLACDNIESLEKSDVPDVLLVEGYDEELFINGKSVCVHKCLYPSDVLNALSENGCV